MTFSASDSIDQIKGKTLMSEKLRIKRSKPTSEEQHTELPQLEELYKAPKFDYKLYYQQTLEAEARGEPPPPPVQTQTEQPVERKRTFNKLEELNRSQNGLPYYSDGTIPSLHGEDKEEEEDDCPLPYAEYHGNVQPIKIERYDDPSTLIKVKAEKRLSKRDILAEKGRRNLRALGGFIIICSLVMFAFSMSKIEFAYRIDGLIFGIFKSALLPVINSVMAVRLMKGDSKSRFFFGAVSLLSVIGMIALVIMSVIGSIEVVGNLFCELYVNFGYKLGQKLLEIAELTPMELAKKLLPYFLLMLFVLIPSLFDKSIAAYCSED